MSFQGTQWGCWSALELEQPLICVDVRGAGLGWAALGGAGMLSICLGLSRGHSHSFRPSSCSVWDHHLTELCVVRRILSQWKVPCGKGSMVEMKLPVGNDSQFP